MKNRRKHTIWPAELWEQVEAYAQSVRRATGEQYPDDHALRDLVRMGLKAVGKRRGSRTAR